MRTGLVGLAAAPCVSCSVGSPIGSPADDPPAQTNAALRPTLGEIRSAGERVRDLYAPKGPQRKGDWLTEHDEVGQSFDQFLAKRKTRAKHLYETIYIQPLGEFTPVQQKLLDRTAEFLSLFYGFPVKTLEPVSLEDLPADARRVHPEWGDEQILTTHLLYKVLQPRLPRDAVAMLGLTASDLYPKPGWNYVFGQASLEERVGVWSIYRKGRPDASDAEYRLCLRRTLGTAAHETGHMCGIQHCIAYECGMNGQTISPSRVGIRSNSARNACKRCGGPAVSIP